MAWHCSGWISGLSIPTAKRLRSHHGNLSQAEGSHCQIQNPSLCIQSMPGYADLFEDGLSCLTLDPPMPIAKHFSSAAIDQAGRLAIVSPSTFGSQKDSFQILRFDRAPCGPSNSPLTLIRLAPLLTDPMEATRQLHALMKTQVGATERKWRLFGSKKRLCSLLLSVTAINVRLCVGGASREAGPIEALRIGHRH